MQVAPCQPVLVSRRWLASTAQEAGTGSVQVAPCHPVTGALLDDHHDRADPARGSRPEHHTGDTQGDAQRRAGPVDVEGVAQQSRSGPTHTAGSGQQRLGGPVEDDAAQRPSGPDEVDGDAQRPGSRAAPGASRAPAVRSGAERYRPSGRLARRVRARDRRCRFPGCSVAAVFCDLDHVRPWPGGPTTVGNLMCLCRRHHRVKQRPGWRVALASDGTATWTDPTGRIRSTEPVDALSVTVLRGADPPATAPDPPSTTSPTGTPSTTSITGTTGTPSRTRTVLPDGPHSTLEFLLEHQGAAPPAPSPTRAWRDERDRPGRRHRAELQPARGTLLVTDPDHWPHRRNGRNRRNPCGGDSDPPPF